MEQSEFAENCHELLGKLFEATRHTSKGWDFKQIRFLVGSLKEAFGHVVPVNLDDDADQIEAPSHYCRNGIEVVKVLQTFLTPEEFEGWCRGNILAYQLRARWKQNCDMDLKKADRINRFLIRHLEGVDIVD